MAPFVFRSTIWVTAVGPDRFDGFDGSAKVFDETGSVDLGQRCRVFRPKWWVTIATRDWWKAFSFNSQWFLYLWCASDRLFFSSQRESNRVEIVSLRPLISPQSQQRNHDTWIITSNPSNKSLWIWSQHGGVLLMQVLYAIKFGWSDSMDSSVPWNFWLWGKFWRRNHTDTSAARLGRYHIFWHSFTLFTVLIPSVSDDFRNRFSMMNGKHSQRQGSREYCARSSKVRLEISEMPIASISVGNHLGHPISIVYFFSVFLAWTHLWSM